MSNVFQSGLCSSNTWWAMVHYFCSWVTRNHGNPKLGTLDFTGSERGLPSIFLKAQPWQYFIIRSVVSLESCFCVTCKNTHALVQLFKRWITLPSWPISIQWIEQSVFLILIHWIMIHPMDSAIQHLNNRSLENKLHKKRKTEGKWSSLYYTA